MTATGRGPLLPYFALVMLCTISLGAVFTTLAELRDQLGISETGLGLMVGMGFLAAFVSQIALSRYADRGHSETMIRFGLLTVVASHVGMTLGTELWHLVGARVLLGLGLGLIFPSVRRIVINHDPRQVGANLGLLGSFDIGGFVVGPLLAGLLLHFVGLRAPFVLLAVATLAFVPFVARLPPDTGAVAEDGRAVLSRLLSRRGVRASLVVGIGWFAMIGTFEAVWAVLLTDRGAETWLIAVTLAIIVIPMVFLAPLGGRLAQRHGPLRVAGLGVLAAVPCVVAYGFIESVAVLTVFAVLQGVSDAVTFPATQVGAAMTAEPDELASAQGLLSATLELTAGVMAFAAGAAYDHFGAEALFTATGIVMVAGVAVAGAIARPLAARRDPAVWGDGAIASATLD